MKSSQHPAEEIIRILAQAVGPHHQANVLHGL